MPDRTIDPGEACDDGNATSGDGCSATCHVESGYACTGQPSTCATACGDGLVGGAEQCDDGNFTAGDGCAACQVENGFACTGQPSACVQPVQRVDVWEPGAPATFQAGFVAGEAAAVTLGPLPRAVNLTAVRLLFGGAAGTQTVTLRVYQDQGVAGPGTVLFDGDYQMTAADAAMQEFSLLPSIGIPAGQAFRLTVFWQHAGLPSIPRDAGTSVPGANWVFASGAWWPWTSLGGTGNFILRAVVE